jgi:hypothetical protein
LGLAQQPVEEGAEVAMGPDLPFPSPTLPAPLAMRVGKCASRLAEMASYQAAVVGNAALASQVGLATTDATKCCAAVASYAVIVASAISALAVTWDQANVAYHQARICGHDWFYWTNANQALTQEEQDLTASGAMVTQSRYWRKVNGYRGCLDDIFINGVNRCNLSNDGTDIEKAGARTITNQLFREFIYGGREYTDSGSGSCDSPKTWSHKKRMTILGYDDGAMRYYMTGPGNAPVYSCNRFLVQSENEDDRVASRAAYECCKQRSQNAICIESRGGIGSIVDPNFSHKFCEIGSKCSVGRITYEIFKSRRKVKTH